MTIKIKTQTGNLLNVTTGHIVHGCNAQGVMGSGVALAIKRKYPTAYQAYRDEYELNGLVLGYAYDYSVTPYLKIWNAITQQGFGAPTRNVSYDAIQTCFEQVNRYIADEGRHGADDRQAKEIHIPLIGAGLGGGNWNIIKTIIEETVNYPTTLWVLPT